MLGNKMADILVKTKSNSVGIYQLHAYGSQHLLVVLVWVYVHTCLNHFSNAHYNMLIFVRNEFVLYESYTLKIYGLKCLGPKSGKYGLSDHVVLTLLAPT